jgi:hypothetical protein
MFVLLIAAAVVLFMFACDYVFDGEKVFHTAPVDHSAFAVRPFTTIQQLVTSK